MSSSHTQMTDSIKLLNPDKWLILFGTMRATGRMPRDSLETIVKYLQLSFDTCIDKIISNHRLTGDQKQGRIKRSFTHRLMNGLNTRSFPWWLCEGLLFECNTQLLKDHTHLSENQLETYLTGPFAEAIQTSYVFTELNAHIQRRYQFLV